MTHSTTSSAPTPRLWIAVRSQEPVYPENENEWQVIEDGIGVMIAILAGPLDTEVAGNARVMAAALDLLHAAKAVISCWESGNLAEAVHWLSSAIARAEGK